MTPEQQARAIVAEHVHDLHDSTARALIVSIADAIRAAEAAAIEQARVRNTGADAIKVSAPDPIPEPAVGHEWGQRTVTGIHPQTGLHGAYLTYRTARNSGSISLSGWKTWARKTGAKPAPTVPRSEADSA